MKNECSVVRDILPYTLKTWLATKRGQLSKNILKIVLNVLRSLKY